MKATTNYNFKLPEDADPVRPTPFNENFTIIDQALKALADKSNQVQGDIANLQISDSVASLLGLDPTKNPTTDDGFLAAYCLAKGGKIVKLHITCGGKPAKAGIPISGATKLDGSPLVTDGTAEILAFATGSPATLTTPAYLDMAAGQIVINTQSNSVQEVNWVLPAPTAGINVFATTTSFQFSPYVTTYDVCAVGGGGGGGSGNKSGYMTWPGGGGGGGYVTNKLNVAAVANKSYSVTVGAGGAPGVAGGASSLVVNGSTVAAASGGQPGWTDNTDIYNPKGTGGTGNGRGGDEGQVGSPGTVRRFGETSEMLLGGGGAGGNESGSEKLTGGAPYGGKGGAVGAAASAGSGPGGGGGGAPCENTSGAAGYQGEIALRWRISV